ncbi:MAG: Gfo/Idh/MocA family oxidoreductase [Chthoniobacterales bacterium]
MSQPIKTAIIGLGRAGWHLHLEPMLKHGGYQITAVTDPIAERRKEAQEKCGCEEYENIDALLAKADCELVIVATPSAFHFSDAQKVLEAGKHCALEKPMALNFEEASKLAELAKSKKLLLTVNHAYLFLPEFHHLKEVVDSGVLGRIFHIRGFWPRYSRRWDWQTLKKNGGGILNNWGSHIASVALPLLDSKVASVASDIQLVKDAGDTEDHMEILLKTESGASANLLVTSACAYPGVRWMLLGEFGTLSSDGTTSHLKYYDPADAPRPQLDESMAAASRKYNSEELPWKEKSMPSEPSTPVPTFHENLAAFLGGKAPLISSAEAAVEVIRVLDLARVGSGF